MAGSVQKATPPDRNTIIIRHGRKSLNRSRLHQQEQTVRPRIELSSYRSFASGIENSTRIILNEFVLLQNCTPQFSYSSIESLSQRNLSDGPDRTNPESGSTDRKVRGTSVLSSAVSQAGIEVRQTSHLKHKRIQSNLDLPAACSRSKSATSTFPYASDSWYGV